MARWTVSRLPARSVGGRAKAHCNIAGGDHQIVQGSHPGHPGSETAPVAGMEGNLPELKNHTDNEKK